MDKMEQMEQAILSIEDEMNESLAITDVMMSAYSSNQGPSDESAAFVMGMLYERLKIINGKLDAARGVQAEEA